MSFVLRFAEEIILLSLDDKTGRLHALPERALEFALAGAVLAVMILPIITSVSREVFRQTPTSHTEAAQALGATKWEVVRMTGERFSTS